MANAKISDNSVFIPKSDILDVVGLAGYDSSGNVKISGANLKASVLSGSITTITGTAPISVTSGSTPVVSISQATTSTNGYLSSTDWNTFNSKTGNLGTVTTVSASVSGSAYTATVSNATTTPSISIAPQGSSSQYINGAGNLTTFPTLPTVSNNTITLSPGSGLSGGGDFTLNQSSDKTITFTNTITNNNQLTNGAGYITSSSLPTVGNGKLTITVDGTATEFTANQSGDTNLSFTTGSGTSIPVSDEGTQITSGVTSLDFVGAGVTASASGNDVTVTITGGGGSGGTVTSVSALTLGTTGTDLTSTVANSTTTPTITLNVPSASASNRGALTSTDWTTFNNKTDNTGTITEIIASSPLTGGTITSSGTIGIPQATTSASGYLTSTDWNTFNNKTAFAEPAIFSGGGSPSLATGVTGLEIRTLIGAGVGDGIVTSLTTTGTSGVATLSSGVLNIPNYATSGGGTVTEVTVSAPLTVSNGTTTPALNITQSDATTDGYLSSTDWSTFNNKGSGTVTAVTGTAPVSVTSGNAPVVSMSAANGSTNGYLTSTDWTTFNSKSNFSGAYADLTGKPTIPTGSNPTATISGTVVNGVASTFMRSDAVPALGNTITIGTGGTARGLVDIEGGNSLDAQLRLNCSAGTHAVTIEGPQHSGGNNYIIKLPNGAPALNKILKVGTYAANAGTYADPSLATMVWDDSGGDNIYTADGTIGATSGNDIRTVTIGGTSQATANHIVIQEPNQSNWGNKIGPLIVKGSGNSVASLGVNGTGNAALSGYGIEFLIGANYTNRTTALATAGAINQQGKWTIGGDVGIGGTYVNNQKLTIKGAGVTSSTTALAIQDSSGADIFNVTDDGEVKIESNLSNYTGFRIKAANGASGINAVAYISDNYSGSTLQDIKPFLAKKATSGTNNRDTLFLGPASSTSVGYNNAGHTVVNGPWQGGAPSFNTAGSYFAPMITSSMFIAGGANETGLFIGSGGQDSSHYALQVRSDNAHLNGSVWFQLRGDDRIVYKDGNEAVDKVLTCDADGVATWQTSGGSSGGGFPSAVASTVASPLVAGSIYLLTSSGASVATLPAGSSADVIGVKWVARGATTDSLVVKTQTGKKIDGVVRDTNGLPLASLNNYYEFVCDGTDWYIK